MLSRDGGASAVAAVSRWAKHVDGQDVWYTSLDDPSMEPQWSIPTGGIVENETIYR